MTFGIIFFSCNLKGRNIPKGTQVLFFQWGIENPCLSRYEILRATNFFSLCSLLVFSRRGRRRRKRSLDFGTISKTRFNCCCCYIDSFLYCLYTHPLTFTKEFVISIITESDFVSMFEIKHFLTKLSFIFKCQLRNHLCLTYLR